jgi:hypothetical protein
LIFKGIESRALLRFIIYFTGEFDDGKFLFLADIKLVDEFVVYFHEFFLEDGDLLLVLAALAPGGGGGGRRLRVDHITVKFNLIIIIAD